ncbi:sensor histidine kinase [Nocardiopsis nanhaiensis]
MNQETGPPRTPLDAVRRRRFLRSSWPWRSLGHLASTLLVGVAASFVMTPILAPLVIAGEALGSAQRDPQEMWIAAALLLMVVLLTLICGPLVAIALAGVERWRLRLVHPPVASGHRTAGPGLFGWLRVRYTEAATWREFAYLALLTLVIDPIAYALLFLFVGMGAFLALGPVITAFGETMALGPWQVDDPVTALVLVPPGAALLLASPYALALTVGAHASLSRTLLGGRDTEELRSELVEVTRSRARLVDAFETERRRIERDLHDGAQQQLISLAMQVGLARMDAPPGSDMERTLASVHGQAKEVIGSLREIIRGIHPKVLSDRGLPAALPELADRSAVPVRTRVDLPRRLPSHVESTAYYVASETLSNVAKHAEATEVRLNASLDGDTLVVETTDDGRGGADPDGGTGLTGLADRVAVVGGRIWLSSPPGGPTRLRAEIPCQPASE